MAKRKKQSAKSKELARIKRQIKRMEKREYRFSDDFKESLANLSWQKLRTITTSKLYESATAISEAAEIITGIEKLKQERSSIAKKAAKTRKFYATPEGKELLAQIGGKKKSKSRKKFEKELLEKEKKQKELAEKYELGQMVLSRVQDLINTYPSTGALYLGKMLQSEISKYGERAVTMGMAQAPDRVIELTETIAYESTGRRGNEKVHQSFVNLAQIISGTIASSDESKSYGEISDTIGYEQENED